MYCNSSSVVQVDTSRYSWESLKESYQQLLSVPEDGAKALPPLPQPIEDSQAAAPTSSP